MKKILFTIALFSSVSLLSLQAKKKENKNIKSNQFELRTTTDTLSYAYGVETAKHGLVPYLIQLEVIADTSAVSNDLRSQIQNATSDAEKELLQKELQTKLDSIQKNNEKNLFSFIEGMKARINSKESDPYKKGMDLASQVEMMGKNFEEQALKEDTEKIDLNLIITGISDEIIHNNPRLSDTKKIVEDRIEELQKQQTKQNEKLNTEKIAKNEAFMTENAKKEGVKTLPSGIQYKIEKEGKGAIPTASDKVKVHYSGKLLDGTEFDSSIKRGEPITFGVQQVIPGWTEILQLMPVGSKWTVYIPYNLAYGAEGTGPIPAYSNLIFDIELLDIEK